VEICCPGNIPVATAHQGGEYALAVSSSGLRILRYGSGAMNSTVSAPWLPTQGMYEAAFAPDGVRAVIVGRAGGTPLAASVLELRDDLYTAAEITDVSIPSFDLPPYLGTGSTWLLGSAWRPGCDAGLIVGGETGVGGSTGQVIEFAHVGGVSCASESSVPTLNHPLGLRLALLVALFTLAAFRRAGMVRA
jgi:hypothetical protein